MEKVLGFGGVFVRARDRAALARWYRDHLGFAIDEEWWGSQFPLTHPDDHAGAHQVFGVFPPDTEYFGAATNAYMINLRVRDLDAMLAQLRRMGCDVAKETQRSDFGAFGWVTDPEGNRIELWEPPDSSAFAP